MALTLERQLLPPVKLKTPIVSNLLKKTRLKLAKKCRYNLVLGKEKAFLYQMHMFILQIFFRIRLGLLSSLFKLEWKRMIVCTSTLKEGEKEDLKQTLLKIG